LTNYKLFDPLEQFVDEIASCSSSFVEAFFFTSSQLSPEDILWLVLILSLDIEPMVNSTANQYYTSDLLVESAIQSTILEVSNENSATDTIGFIADGFLDLTLISLIFANLVGLIPINITTTATLISNLTAALGFFIYINLNGLIHKKLTMAELLLPQGTPLPIIPFLIMIETISYIAKIISLAVRLFANMTAGHTLLEILCIFTVSALFVNQLSWSIAWLPVIVLILISFLEFMISLLQSYVYTILSFIFISDIFSDSH